MEILKIDDYHIIPMSGHVMVSEIAKCSETLFSDKKTALNRPPARLRTTRPPINGGGGEQAQKVKFPKMARFSETAKCPETRLDTGRIDC